jgi:uncharacterized protein YjbI with pentapeptide repeats
MAEPETEAAPSSRRPVDLWRARAMGWDFAWDSASGYVYLDPMTCSVPRGFPSAGVAGEGGPRVSLRDYWRWSAGLPGENRLLTDEELLAAGLLVTVDGKLYHVIHAPDMSLKTGRDGEPLEILVSLLRARTHDGGELRLDGAWLPGALLQAAGPKGPLQLSHAHISAACLSGTLPGPVRGAFMLFSGETRLSDALFEGRVDFECCVFDGPAVFSRARFQKGVTFSDARFLGAADFFETDFAGDAFFSHAIFAGRPSFRKACFRGKVRFHGASFERSVDFTAAIFTGAAEFSLAQFCEGGRFDEAVFYNFFDFELSRFGGEVSFRNITYHPINGFPHHELLKLPPRLGSARFAANELFDSRAIAWRSFL